MSRATVLARAAPTLAGCALFLPPGLYTLDNDLDLLRDVTIFGAGVGTTVIAGDRSSEKSDPEVESTKRGGLHVAPPSSDVDAKMSKSLSAPATGSGEFDSQTIIHLPKRLTAPAAASVFSSLVNPSNACAAAGVC